MKSALFSRDIYSLHPAKRREILQGLDVKLPSHAGTKPCDLKIEGADKLLRNLSGGLDGVYAVWSCENGRPLYKRQQSPQGRKFPSYGFKAVSH